MQNNKVLFEKISKIVTNLENNVAAYTVYCGKKSMFVEKNHNNLVQNSM